MEGRKSKKSEKENGDKNPLWAKKYLLVIARERFPTVSNGIQCVGRILAFSVLQYFSIGITTLLDFNDVVCCPDIGCSQLKWVWDWHPCTPNQILMKARGNKRKLYAASGQPWPSFRAAAGVAHHVQMQEPEEVALVGPQGVRWPKSG